MILQLSDNESTVSLAGQQNLQHGARTELALGACPLAVNPFLILVTSHGSAGTKVNTCCLQMAYGVGTLWFKDSEGDLDDRTVEAIQAAIDAGFRHFDGAQSKLQRHYPRFLAASSG